jgi:hypothetical protein
MAPDVPHDINTDSEALPIYAGRENLGVATLALHDHGDGSFTRLGKLRDAASLPSSTRWRTLWCLLPELARFPRPGMGNARALRVNREGRHPVRGPDYALVRVAVHTELRHVLTADPSAGQGLRRSSTRRSSNFLNLSIARSSRQQAMRRATKCEAPARW